MPNRMLRDWTDSDAVNSLSVNAERFFTRLIMKVDDYGRYYANEKLLKPQLYPFLIDKIRETDITLWMAECQKAGLIAVYEIASKKYLQIVNFNQRLRQKTVKYPPPPDDGQMTDTCQTDDGLKRREVEVEVEEKETLPASAGASDPHSVHKGLYGNTEKSKSSVYAFIKNNIPQFIEPYIDFWNLFAKEKSLPVVSKVNATRKKKFAVRIKEPGFKFTEIIRKASVSQFLLTGSWFGFDWIIDNDSNYLKVIEGNYDSKDKAAEPAKRQIVT